MTYTIAQIAKKFNTSVYTLRYYDREGLMPYVERNKAGIRIFKELDLGWLKLINCLKQSGLPIKKIKKYVDWGMEGDSTIEKRLNLIKEHKKDVEKQIQELQKHMKHIDYKVWYYETALEAGTTAIHEQEPKLAKVD